MSLLSLSSSKVFVVRHKDELSFDFDSADRYECIIGLTEEFRLHENIVLKSQLSRRGLIRLIVASHPVVIPSLTKSSGLIAAEACAMKKPALCDETQAVPQVFSGKYIFVNPKSSKEAEEGVERIYRGGVRKAERKHFTRKNEKANFLHFIKGFLNACHRRF